MTSASAELNRALARFPVVYSLHEPGGLVIAFVATNDFGAAERWAQMQQPVLRDGGIILSWQHGFPTQSFTLARCGCPHDGKDGRP